MKWDIDLQPENIINRVFTLKYSPQMVSDSLQAFVIKLSLLVFSFILLKQLVVGQQLSWVSALLVAVICFLLTYLIVQVLSLLQEVVGTKRVFLAFAALAILALIIVLL